MLLYLIPLYLLAADFTSLEDEKVDSLIQTRAEKISKIITHYKMSPWLRLKSKIESENMGIGFMKGRRCDEKATAIKSLGSLVAEVLKVDTFAEEKFLGVAKTSHPKLYKLWEKKNKEKIHVEQLANILRYLAMTYTLFDLQGATLEREMIDYRDLKKMWREGELLSSVKKFFAIPQGEEYGMGSLFISKEECDQSLIHFRNVIDGQEEDGELCQKARENFAASNRLREEFEQIQRSFLTSLTTSDLEKLLLDPRFIKIVYQGQNYREKIQDRYNVKLPQIYFKEFK